MDALAQLDAERRALVLVALLREGAAAEALLARGPDGARCAAAARLLLALPPRVRAERLALEARRLFAPLPAGLAEIHPTWIEDALGAESPLVRTVLRQGGPTPALTTYLRRRILGHLYAMPQGQPRARALIDLDDLPKLSFVALERALEGLGRRRVAGAFAAAGSEALAQLAARLGEPLGSALVAEARALGRLDREEARRAQEELFELARHIQGGRSLFLRAGSRRLAPALAQRGDLLHQVAQRLPMLLGLMLLEESEAPPADVNRLVADLRAIL